MELGPHLSALRNAKGLSQAELAEALDVSRQSVSKWETGASVPDLEKLLKLSDLFGISLDRLVRGTGADETDSAGAAPFASTEPSAASPISGTPADAASPGESSAPERPPSPEHGERPSAPADQLPTRKKVGLILLILGGALAVILLVLSGWIGPLLTLPLFLCSGICFWTRRHPGLWCTWLLLLGAFVLLHLLPQILWPGAAMLPYAALLPLLGWAKLILCAVLLTGFARFLHARSKS